MLLVALSCRKHGSSNYYESMIMLNGHCFADVATFKWKLSMIPYSLMSSYLFILDHHRFCSSASDFSHRLLLLRLQIVIDDMSIILIANSAFFSPILSPSSV